MRARRYMFERDDLIGAMTQQDYERGREKQ